MTARVFGGALALAIGLGPASDGMAEPARFLFGAQGGPAGQPAPIGGYARGCLAGGVPLAETGPGWQAMRLSRNRNWGHPAMIAFVERLAKEAQALGWPGVYVGDISQPRGGPMLSGHASHQIGLDADIWLRRPADAPLSRGDRERVSSVNVVAPGGRSVNASWSASHHELIRAAASDAAVARIFVNPAIKKALCEGEPASADRRWLRRVRAWFGHDSHFHVRLACPADAVSCVDQPAPPPGDGCGEELASWFRPPDPNATPAPRTGPPRGRHIALADMPQACQRLVR